MLSRLIANKTFRAYLMPAIVFVTGACVLVIEVVAARILSPYYGNTIFSYSSIIGVVLAALSVGYYVGGHLADKRPSAKLFFAIIAAGGFSVLILHILCLTLLPTLSRTFSITSGPLISSVILFFVPAGLLGMLSPFAIKLQQRLAPNKQIGTVVGDMFFWSTLGSIAGSLGTGFLLIPWLGTNVIVMCVGLVLIAMSVSALLLLGGIRLKHGPLGIMLIGVGLITLLTNLSLNSASAQSPYLYQKDGLYEKITIYDGKHGGRPTRFFKQDKSSSGAMYLESDDLVYNYTKYYSLYKLTKADTRQALVIGGGVYSIPKALLSDLPQATVTVSEIEPSLPALAEKYFKTPATPRLKHSTKDGRRLLTDSPQKYDYIFSDVYYSLYSIPPHFTTKEFFALAQQRLSQDGIFIANMIGSTAPDDHSFILSEMRTFQTAFPNSYFFATGNPRSGSVQNIMFVGIKNDQRLDLSSPDIAGSQDSIIAKLSSHAINPADYALERYPILTDNYAPVERLIMPLLSGRSRNASASLQPDGGIMMNAIRQQLSYGPRHPSAPGHANVQDYIEQQARRIGSNVHRQNWQQTDPQTGKVHNLSNLVLRLNPHAKQRVIIGAHYDSKYTANHDETDPSATVPGANDSGSGVAVLLEAARVLANEETLPIGLDFVFFDGEEGFERPDIDQNGWAPLGSEHFAANLKDYYPDQLPESGLIIDMVCQKGLRLQREANSMDAAASYTDKFWHIGEKIAPQTFSSLLGPIIYDDHVPLINAGIPAFVVIDLDYDAWHTSHDTIDQCEAKSLETVAKTLVSYIRQY